MLDVVYASMHLQLSLKNQLSELPRAFIVQEEFVHGTNDKCWYKKSSKVIVRRKIEHQLIFLKTEELEFEVQLGQDQQCVNIPHKSKTSEANTPVTDAKPMENTHLRYCRYHMTVVRAHLVNYLAFAGHSTETWSFFSNLGVAVKRF